MASSPVILLYPIKFRETSVTSTVIGCNIVTSHKSQAPGFVKPQFQFRMLRGTMITIFRDCTTSATKSFFVELKLLGVTWLIPCVLLVKRLQLVKHCWDLPNLWQILVTCDGKTTFSSFSICSLTFCVFQWLILSSSKNRFLHNILTIELMVSPPKGASMILLGLVSRFSATKM